MATAVETSSQPRAPSPPAKLLAASLVGAVYVVAALAVVLYAVPGLWAEYVTPATGGNKLMDGFLRTAVQVAALIGLVAFGRSLAGANPPRGLRGGIFLMLVAAALIFFITRWVGVSTEGVPGQIVTAVIGLGLLFGAFKLFTSARGEGWMVALEEQGWFHAHGYKRVLGQRVRRLTMLGLLLIGATGVYSLYFQGTLPDQWTIGIPFTQKAGAPEGTPQTFTLLNDAKITIPLILIGLTFWVAYRAVNVPIFAEFLIATEAEMNKVSWTGRRRLTQDTIVVLVTTILMALFLLLMDLFWGWLLTAVDVLPARPTKAEKQAEGARW